MFTKRRTSTPLPPKQEAVRRRVSYEANRDINGFLRFVCDIAVPVNDSSTRLPLPKAREWL